VLLHHIRLRRKFFFFDTNAEFFSFLFSFLTHMKNIFSYDGYLFIRPAHKI